MAEHILPDKNWRIALRRYRISAESCAKEIRAVLLRDRAELQQQLAAATERAEREHASAMEAGRLMSEACRDAGEMRGERDGLLLRLQVVEADNAALREALEQVQWAGQVTTSEGLHAACPVCHGVRGKGHVPECPVGNALTSDHPGAALLADVREVLQAVRSDLLSVLKHCDLSINTAGCLRARAEEIDAFMDARSWDKGE